MGKAGGVRSPVSAGAGASNKQGEMKGALGKHIGRYLDQYTFICVFGSVVGYVMMPLIGVQLCVCVRIYHFITVIPIKL